MSYEGSCAPGRATACCAPHPDLPPTSEKRDLRYPTILRVRKETYNIVLRVGTCLRGGTVNTNEKRDLLYDKRDPLYLTRRRDLPQWWEC